MRNKKLILILFSLLWVSHTLGAENIYVYRNDGYFNAFFSDEVKDMKYSKLGVDGKTYNDFVTQEIQTVDSLYRIPLNVIDSISVKEPEININPDVIRLDDNRLSYITKVEGMQIKFSSTMPQSLRPKQNDILLCEDFNELFPEGFAGRVSSILLDGTYTINCEEVGLLDIYDRFTVMDEFTLVEGPEPEKPRLVKRNVGGEFEIPYNITFPFNVNDDNFDLSGHFSQNIVFRIAADITRESQYIEFQIALDNEAKVNLSASRDLIKLKKYKTLKEFSIPIPFPQLRGWTLNLAFAPFAKLNMDGKAEAVGRSSQKYSLIYRNDEPVRFIPYSSGVSMDYEIDEEVSGQFWGGICITPHLSYLKGLVDIAEDIYIGPTITGNLTADIGNLLKDKNAYSAFKDTKVTLGVKPAHQFSITVNLFKQDIFKYQTNLFECSPLGEWDFFLFPEFKGFTVEKNGNSFDVSYEAMRNLIFPCTIGSALTDEQGTSSYSMNNMSYWQQNNSQTTHRENYNNLKANKTYTLQPAISLMGQRLLAMPIERIGIGAYTVTEGASAGKNHAEIYGSYYMEEENAMPDELGFCISSTDQNPSIPTVYGVLISNSDFYGTVENLEESTTYYYRAYMTINGEKLFGKTQCFTTKGDDDPNEEDNDTKESEDGEKPLAYTLGSKVLSFSEANVSFRFENITPETECGFFLSTDMGNDMKWYDLGVINGDYTYKLTDLKPRTKYYYEACARNELGKSFGGELWFETEARPDPIVKVTDVQDIDIRTAKIEVNLGRLPETGEAGIYLLDEDWTYNYPILYKEGSQSYDLGDLQAETNYTIIPFIITEDDLIEGDPKSFTTDSPDILGDWHFYDGGVSSSSGHHTVKLYATGFSNNFWGVNYLEWERNGRQIKIYWKGKPPVSSWTTYIGEFNEDFTEAHGEVYFEYFDITVQDYVLRDENQTWYIKRQNE